MNEVYEVDAVKNEFLQNVGDEYLKVFTPQQMELAAYLLNDFCNNLAGNGLFLVRIQQPPQPQPVPQAAGFPQQNPFGNEEREVARSVREMNAQLQQPRQQYRAPEPMPMPMPPLPPSEQEVDLQSEKPKTFTDKIREMRVGRKGDRINPEE